MIKKLKHKFILINMLLVSIILLITFTAVYYATYRNLRNDSIDVMRKVAQRDYSYNLFPILGKNETVYDPELAAYSTFYINISKDNRIVSVVGYNYNLTNDDLERLTSIVNVIDSEGKSMGILSEENARFMVIEVQSGRKIVFLDRTNEQNTLKSLVGTSVFVGVCSLLAFFLLSIVLARMAIAPVEKSWNQQKQLVADASHELKTPLTVVNTNTDIVLAHPESTVAEQQKWLEYNKLEIQRMTELINNMLYLAKNDDAIQSLNLSEVDLSELTISCLLPYETICFENHRILKSNINENITIEGDASLLKQLILILLDNANKYSEDGGIINVRLYTKQNKAILEVNNGGTVIPSESLERIFERFYRVEKSRAREKGGYGLGLSIAKNIIDKHKAKISVSSNIEDGTTFTCQFQIKA